VEARYQPESCCVITGRSLLCLRKVGEKLSIDRIDSTMGYVPGNTQLMAESLNRAKGRQDSVPRYALNRLLRRLARVVEDKLSNSEGAVILQ
jgi:hypothetical protein